MRLTLLPYLQHFTYGAAFSLLVAAGMAVPVPQDVTLILSGYLIHRGAMNAMIAVPVCILGAVGGDLMLFSIARRSTARLMGHRLTARILTPQRVARAEEALHRHGATTIMVSRHVPGLRAGVCAVAGASGMRIGRFIFWDTIAAVPSVGLMLSLGYLFSDRVAWIQRRVTHVERWVAVAALGTLALALVAAWLYRRRLGETRGR
jgi:membrane protein DedA with SNARE-associated domain